MAIKCICAEEFCTGCGTCIQVCPKHAIKMQENQEGFLYPVIDNNCIECGLCVKKCPVNSVPQKHSATFYMGWHKDREILLSSSSGGLFTAISRYVFERHGVVFGAVKDGKGDIIHMAARSEEELAPLKLSKYYQSIIGDAYKIAKDYLVDGRMVLFTGTACQIAGLKNYLGKEYKNLITIDVLCHGVASKRVVEAFIKSKEKQFKKKVTDYNFRVKEAERGWYNGGGTRMHLFFEDGTSITEPGKYDTYFLGFNNNYFLRESCYRCKFCGTDRVSDFTLADYWKCNNPDLISEEQKKLGVALVLANTEKAKEVLSEIQDQVIMYEIDGTDAISHNRALDKPQDRPEIRNDFYTLLSNMDYDSIIYNQFKSRFRKRKIKILLKHVIPSSLYTRCFKD